MPIRFSMEPTNADIYKKLEKIESMVAALQKEEEAIEKTEKVIAREEKSELNLIRKINMPKRRFDSIFLWEEHIWNHCPDKLEDEAKKEVDFVCKKTKRPCRFLDCYRNSLDTKA